MESEFGEGDAQQTKDRTVSLTWGLERLVRVVASPVLATHWIFCTRARPASTGQLNVSCINNLQNTSLTIKQVLMVKVLLLQVINPLCIRTTVLWDK
jgi:hypothetical protein